MKHNNKTGFTAVVVIFVLVAVIAAITVITYMVLSRQSTSSTMDSMDSGHGDAMMEATPMPSPSPVSDSTDLNTIEKELNDTVVGTPDADINSMSSDAASL